MLVHLEVQTAVHIPLKKSPDEFEMIIASLAAKRITSLTVGAIRSSSHRETIFLLEFDLVGPLKSWTVMEGWIEPVVVHVRWQECAILNQEFDSFLVSFFGCNMKGSPCFIETKLHEQLHNGA